MMRRSPLSTCASVLLLALSPWAASCGDVEDDAPIETPEFIPQPIPNRAPAPPPTSLNCPNGTRLTYENFGEGFMLNHCTSCHSAALPEDARGGSPTDANFDTPDAVSLWRAVILVRTTGDKANMPPSGTVTSTDKTLLSEWLNCGAPAGPDQIE